MAFIPPSLLPLIFFAVIRSVTVSAAEFQVGGIVGWRIPATNETQLYNVWASRRRFHIGDSLRFRYKDDSVAVVKKWGYYHCDSSNPIAFFIDGDTLINLDNVGTMYFISGDPHRCRKGVNMMLNVMKSYLPPTTSIPPETPYSVVTPSPSQFLSSWDPPDTTSLGPSSSDPLASFSVSVTAVIVGLGMGLCLLNP